jgi:D-glycero-D-manno-heptose 1,7-bisphosphate phosphatase
MTKLAIFDRDATIIDVVRDEEAGTLSVAFHPDQIRLLDGAVEGMRALQAAGYVLAIATNQPGPAKGQFSADAVRRTNDALVSVLAAQGVQIAALEVCMHHPDGGPGGDSRLVGVCDCRKPKPGMISALVERLGADRGQSWMIGDGAGDMQAGRAAGVNTALVFLLNRCELCPLRGGVGSLTGLAGAAPDVHGSTLAEVASGILRHASGTRATLKTR